MRPPSPTVICSRWYTPLAERQGKTTLVELTLFGILGALTFGMKVVMAPLPNIEPVSLMVMLFSVTFGRKALYPIYTYVLLELFLYGVSLWVINYLYIWAILALGAWLMRKEEHPLAWAMLSGGFGLQFGALCAPVDMVIGGVGYAVARWISGIPYDLLHGVGNFVIALGLFTPMRRLIGRLYQNMKSNHH